MELEVKHFKLMVALAETGNMTKAAQDLHLTQSALSHQLRDAEERVGVSLFERRNKRLFLTPAGKHFVNFSQDMLDRLQTGVKGVRELGCLETRRMRIQAGCYTSFTWIPSLLKEYTQNFPRIQIEIGTSMGDPILDVEEDRADIAIISGSEIKNKHLISKDLFTDEIMLIMAPSHPLASKAVVKGEDLDQHNIIIYNVSDEESTLISAIMKPEGATPGRVMRMDLTEGILESVKAGLGVSILADWAAAPHVSRGNLVMKKVGRKGFHRTWRIIARKKDYQEAYVREFFQLLQSELKGGI